MLSKAALAALDPRTNEAPARFALELRPEQKPRSVAADVLERLAEFEPKVAPISPVDHGILVLNLGNRTLEYADPADAFAASYALADDFGLATAEPDLATPFFPEEDPRPSGAATEEAVLFPPGCWTEAEDGLYTSWALERIKAPQAWAFSEEEGRPPRGRGIVVAQPDTGVAAHAELEGVPRRGGYDVLEDDLDPTDPLIGMNAGHGTATASVAVSQTRGRLNGSAPEATHMPIRAIRSVIQVSQVSVAAAIYRAVDDGAHVITMSLGGLPAAALKRALRRAVAADVIVLAAAGNCVRTVVWPARYDDCIAVAGTNAADRMWKGSCRGPAVDIAAPAQNVFKAQTPSTTAVTQGQGTSFAVALAAGVAALWLAHHGRADLIAAAHSRGETLQEMFRRLVRATARRPSDWDSFELGDGIVDALALLRADFDSGRDREEVPASAPGADPESEVGGLVAETVGLDAVTDCDLNWTRYGPELATLLLHGQLVTVHDDSSWSVKGSEQKERNGTRVDREILVSANLSEAIGNPSLRDYFGLDDDLPAEVWESNHRD